MPQLSILTSKQCQQILNLLRTKAVDDVSCAQTVSNDNQDHLFSEMAGYNSHSSCFQSSINTPTLEDKQTIFSSSSHFQLAVKNAAKYPWIIDTGATDHIVCYVSFLTTITLIVSKKVRLPKGNSANVTHIGSVKIYATLTLTNVLCVPSFSFNLISVNKLVKCFNCCFIFLSQLCFIQQLSSWKTIGQGKEVDGSYHLILHNLEGLNVSSVPVLGFNFAQIKPVPIPVFNSVCNLNSFAAVKVSANVSHSKLGHLSNSRLHLLHHLILEFSSESNKTCSLCPLAKQHRISFPNSITYSTHIFDLIHCDI